MTRDSKKQAELEILRIIFNKKQYPKYTDSERPDFIIHADDDFGVEITEFYQDETGARLHNKPNYVNDILNSNNIHKDDVGKLEVIEKIEYQDRKTGKWKLLDTQGVRQENLSSTDRVALLVKQIQEKSRKLNEYNGSLNYIDLIIFDSRTSLRDNTENLLIRKMFTDISTRRILRWSGYRNIYVIIPESKGCEKDVFQLK